MTRLILSIVLLFASLITNAQTVKIDVKIKNLKNKDVILGHHFSDQLIPDDTITLNSNGYGTFKATEAYPGGMYFLFLPNQNLFDFILSKDQDFTIIADTTNFTETVSFDGSLENKLFSEYQKKMKSTRERQKKLMEELKTSKGDEKKSEEIKNEINKVVEGMNNYHKEIIKNNPDLFFSKFLTATRRPEVPKTITDKKEQYFWFRHHYFDNFDVSDPKLLRTPIYQNTIETYLDKVLMQHYDTLIPEVDILIEKSRTNHELFRYMMVFLFNKYASSQIMTSENVFVHIADKYYIKESDWSDPEYIKKLKVEIANKKKCLIGKTAYNIIYTKLPSDTSSLAKYIEDCKLFKQKGLTIEKSEADSITKYNLKVGVLQDYFDSFKDVGQLQDEKAKYTILWFWTPTCSHCRKETPIFYKEYVDKKMKDKGVKVITIYNNKDITEWSRFADEVKKFYKFIKNNELFEFENTWNPFDRFKANYAIDSSPTLYLLDENKKIIAKKISYEQAFEVIENELKQKEKK